MQIPKDRTARKRNERFKPKKCAFPECKVEFFGTGRAKYCLEHRQKKYRKIIDADKDTAAKELIKLRNPNQTIMHDYVSPELVQMKCALDGCENSFNISILPRVYVYPRYCGDHRNAYKRSIYLQNRNQMLS
jgi:hypothetical protein